MTESKSSLASLVDPRHTAVIVVDMQTIFTDMPLVPAADEVLPRLRRCIDAARTAGTVCIFTQVVIPETRWTDPWKQQWPEWVRAVHAQGSPFHPRFEPQPGDVHLIKDRYSAFVGTELEALLRDRGIRTVVVIGLVTDVCVSGTARDAFQRDFHTITLSDCTAAGSQALHDASLQTHASAFGRVCVSDEVLAAWQTEAVPAKA